MIISTFTFERKIKLDKKLFLVILFAFTLGNGRLVAQYSFSSERQKRNFELLQSKCNHRINLSNQAGNKNFSDTVFRLHNITKDSLDVYFEFRKKTITNIGISLFKDDSLYKFPEEVFKFVERFLLEYYLHDSKDFNKYLLESKIVFNNMGSNSNIDQRLLLSNIKADNVSISLDNKRFKFILNSENYFYSIDVPANYNILTGMDKKESTDLFYLTYRDSKPKKFSKRTGYSFIESDLIKENDLYKLQGDSYYTDINSNLYFILDDSLKYKLLFDYIHYQSVSNYLLIANSINKNIPFRLNIHNYDKSTMRIDIEYQLLLSDLALKGYLPFVGFENTNSENLEVSIVFFNKYFNDIILFHFKTTLLDFYNAINLISCDVYLNIPADNIKNLSSYYLESTQQYDLKIKK
ncbi:MAG: hypothetical protein JXR48_07005 [Candidatus Delongbacteria bacterium]|nr:hypothetical protein [Candidatus Delongbacteria bacterium]